MADGKLLTADRATNGAFVFTVKRTTNARPVVRATGEIWKLNISASVGAFPGIVVFRCKILT